MKAFGIYHVIISHVMTGTSAIDKPYSKKKKKKSREPEHGRSSTES
jgi:hypothetical protein